LFFWGRGKIIFCRWEKGTLAIPQNFNRNRTTQILTATTATGDHVIESRYYTYDSAVNDIWTLVREMTSFCFFRKLCFRVRVRVTARVKIRVRVRVRVRVRIRVEVRVRVSGNTFLVQHFGQSFFFEGEFGDLFSQNSQEFIW